jgi:hypothetical protein
VRCVTTLSKWRLRAGVKKTLKLNTPVSSLLQVCPSLSFNCGIRVKREVMRDEQTCCSEVGARRALPSINGHRSRWFQLRPVGLTAESG